jgi:hypothetical protein
MLGLLHTLCIIPEFTDGEDFWHLNDWYFRPVLARTYVGGEL